MAPDALSLTNVHTFYGDSHILHGVSFSLRPGGVLALLGRNGAGKTTCISTIIGFLKPRDGEIRLFGEPIEGLSPERISHLGIGLVPQGRRIFPSLTVRENLMVAQQRDEHDRQAMERRADLRACFRGCASATRNSPARCPAASSRCWRSGAR